jgi:hypothetical protein
MSAMTTLILFTLSIATAKNTETYICYGKEETYNCIKYDGNDPNVYDYSERYNQGSGRVYEFSDAGTRNPYAPADDEPGKLSTEIEPVNQTPVFIPYNPFYLFQLGRNQ